MYAAPWPLRLLTPILMHMNRGLQGPRPDGCVLGSGGIVFLARGVVMAQGPEGAPRSWA